jgi:hypothetical protein
MECNDRALLDEWMANWKDLVSFEVVGVIPSAEAAAQLAPLRGRVVPYTNARPPRRES